LDRDTEAVAAAFVRGGFALVVHPGPVSVSSVLEGVGTAGSQFVLLSAGGPTQDERSLVRALRMTVETVEGVLAVGRAEPQEREGDTGAAYRVHPDEGEARLLEIAVFCRRRAG
jgi:hypothetical protein